MGYGLREKCFSRAKIFFICACRNQMKYSLSSPPCLPGYFEVCLSYRSHLLGSFCGTYTLSEGTIERGDNCGMILTHFMPELKVSTAFCGLSFVFVFLLFMSSAYMYCFTKFPSNFDLFCCSCSGLAHGMENNIFGFRLAEATAVVGNSHVDGHYVLPDTSLDVSCDCNIDINEDDCNDNYNNNNSNNYNNNDNNNNNNNYDNSEVSI